MTATNAPINLVATATGVSNQVLLTWDYPFSDIVDYYIPTINEVNQAHEYVPSVEGGKPSILLSGMLNGTQYRFTLIAHSVAGGLSANSNQATATPTTVAGPPLAPRNLVGSPENAAIYLSWDAPLSDGGDPIQSYVLSRSIGGIYDWNYTVENIHERHFLMSSLNNGTLYCFMVQAVNSISWGPSSNIVCLTLTAAPATVPDEPNNFIAIPGDSRVDLSWTAPTSDGGSPILSYEIYMSPGGGSISYNGLTAAVTGLSNGQQYTFYVAALNAVGVSDHHGPIYATPAAPPGPPTQLTATPGNGVIYLSWVAPVNTGGSPISYYSIWQNNNVNELDTQFFIAQNGVVTTTATMTGLTNLTHSYKFYVTANNSVASSIPSNIVEATATPVAPGRPNLYSASYVAASGVGKAALSWTAPSDTGGSPITGYNIYYGLDSNPTIWCGYSTSLSKDIYGLATGDDTYFVVTAINAYGESLYSTPARSVYAYGVPSIVTGLTAIPGNQQNTLKWTGPASLYDTHTPIDGFHIYTNNGGWGTPITVASTIRTYTFTGLTNYTTYNYYVVAYNGMGELTEPNAAHATATPLPVLPGAPILNTAVGGANKITLTWTAPTFNGGSPITQYRLYCSTSLTGGYPATHIVDVDDLVLTYDITPLTPGTLYYVAVKASNSVGDSVYSNVKSATPYNTPGMPTGLVVTPGDAHGDASWAAPPSNGGSAIDYYVIYLDNVDIAHPTARTYTISGLNNGQTYYLRVSAHNIMGESALTPAVAFTPRTLPGAPLNLAGVAGNTQVSLTWQPPISNGGAVIDDYKVTYAPGPTYTQIQTVTTGNTNLSKIVTGLTNGTQYIFMVNAHNIAGWSFSYSNYIYLTPVLDPTIPNPPIITSCIPSYNVQTGISSITIVWSAPANNGGSNITGYNIYMDTITDPTHLEGSVSGTTLTFTVDNLTPTVIYYFRVTAVNAVGESNYSDNANAEAMAPPGAPQNLQATAGDTQVFLNWSAPLSDGGATIGYYIVYRLINGNFTWIADVSYTTLTYTDTGLTNGVNYTYVVSAHNLAGIGPQSNSASATPTLTLVAPAAPTVTATPGSSQVVLNWTPNADGGTPITEYVIYYGTSNPADTQFGLALGGNIRTVTVTNLTPGTNYHFGIIAKNIVGSSPLSADVTAIPYTTPGKPTGLTATEGDGQVTLSWNAPANNGYSTIDYYILYKGGVYTASQTALTSIVTGLTNGTTYTFVVSAHNAAGEGPQSDPISATPHVAPPTVPSAPRYLYASPGNAEVTLTWQLPSSDGGATIDLYQVFYGITSDAPVQYIYTTSLLSQTITGLINGTQYYFKVKAHNSAGYGVFSTTVTATPISGVPTAPYFISATSGATGVTLLWQAPTSDGGSALNGYKVFRGATSPPTILHTTTFPGVTTYLSLYVNLTPDQYEYFGIKAFNANGDSPMSNIIGTNLYHIPNAPTLNTVTAVTPTSIQLGWTSPTDVGGTALTGYYVYYGTSATPKIQFGGLFSSATLTTVVSGLVAGTTYYFGVKAVNIVGISSMSNVMSLSSASVPGAPILTAIGADSKVNLSWVAGASNGSPISAYQLEREISTNTWSALVTTTNLTFQDTSRVNGTTYRYRVMAKNDVGWSIYSNIATATPAGVPSAPTLISTVDGTLKVTLTWTAPTSNGGSPITQYIVYAGLNGPTTESAHTDGNLTVDDMWTAGLPDWPVGVRYIFGVRAVNANGSSPMSNTLYGTPLPEVNVPNKPVLNGTAGNKKVILTWVAPFNGGANIDYYIIYRKIGDSYIVEQSTPMLTINILDLTNGTPYTFALAAHNEMGLSELSDDLTLTPVAAIGAPRGLILSLSDSALAVVAQWSPPNDGDEFLNVANYKIYRSPSGDMNTWVNIGSTGTNLLSYTDSTVSFNTRYWYYVTAINTSSPPTESGPSNTANIMISKYVPPPTDVQLTKNLTSPKSFFIQIDVTWANSLGATSHNIYRQIQGEVQTKVSTEQLTQPYSDTQFDGRVSTIVRYGVSANTIWGESSIIWSNYLDTLSIAEAPIWSSLELDTLNVAINLAWIAPSETHGFPITSYNIYRTVSDVSDPTIEASTRYRPPDGVDPEPDTSTTYTDTGNGTPLVADKFYYYAISAVTAYAEGLSSLTDSIGAGLYPSAPTNVIIQAMSSEEGDIPTSTARISWSAPTNHGSTAIIGYNIYYSTDNSIEETDYSLFATTTDTFFIAGSQNIKLYNNTFYHFTVSAINAGGEGDRSNRVSIGTPKTITPPNITNLAYDGTFEYGVGYWEIISSNNVTFTAVPGSSNIFIGVYAGYAGTVGVKQKIILNNTVKHKIYVTSTSYVSAGRGSAILYAYDGNSLELTNIPTTSVSVDLPFEASRKSLIIDCDVELNVQLSLSNFDVSERFGTLDNVVIIDLTEQFGAEAANLLTTDDMDSLFSAYESTIAELGNADYFPEILPISNSTWYNHVRLGGFKDTINVKNIYSIWDNMWDIDENTNVVIGPIEYSNTGLLSAEIYNDYVVSLACGDVKAYGKTHVNVNVTTGNHYYLTTKAAAYYRTNSSSDVQISIYDEITEAYLSILNDRTVARHSTGFVAGSDALTVALTLSSGAGGAEAVFDGIMLLDLTEIFTTDHEPTVGLMNALIGTLTGIDYSTTYGFWVETPQWEAGQLGTPTLNYDTVQTIQLTWDAATSRDGITGYVVFKGIAADALYEAPNGLTTETTWSDTDILLNQSYFYTILPISNSTYGTISNVVYITTGGTLDVAPIITSVTVLYTERGVTLVWSAPISDIPITSYNIYRRYNWQTINFSTPYATVGNVLTYKDNNNEAGLNPGGVYEYYVSAITTVGEGRRSLPKDVTTPYIIPVTGLSAELVVTNGVSEVDISWEYISTTGLTMQYDIFRTVNNIVQTTKYATTGNKTYVDTSIGANKTLDYGIEAWDDVWGRSSRISVRASSATVPSAPRNFTAVNDAIGTITLSWVVPLLTGNSPILMYRIFKDGSTNPIEVASTQRTYADTGLTGGSTHTYYMCATNAIGNGANTPTKTVTVARAPLAPANFAVNDIAGVPVLSWDAPEAIDGATVMKYNIYIGADTGPLTLMAVTDSTIRETSHIYADAGTVYEYEVTAVGAFDLESVRTQTIAHTAPQSVKFLTIENMIENGGFDSLWMSYRGWTPEYKDQVSTINAPEDMPYEGSLRITGGYVYQDVTIIPGETIMITLLANVGETTPNTHVRLRDTEDNILTSVPIDIIGTNRYYLVYHTTTEKGSVYRLSLEVEGM